MGILTAGSKLKDDDDVEGRTKLYNAIVKGQNSPKANIPESFRVLVKELEGLGLNVLLK